MTALRAAVYSRVSTESQDGEDKTSLGQQVSEIEAYASARGYTITARFQDIASGVKRDRPAFQEMQREARRGSFDVVIAWKSDRLARSASSMGDLIESVKAGKVTIETVSGTFDLAYAELLASIAGLEREAIRERFQMGKRGAAKLGKVPVGKPPYGFGRDSDGKPAIVESEAIAIRRMFELYIDGMGTPSIRETLAREYGHRVSAAHIFNSLSTTAYIGEYSYEGIRIACPPIVSRDTFDRAQAVKRAKLVRGTGNTKVTYLLQHLIRCEGCGRLLGARTRREGGKINRYYRCYNGSKACRPHPYISADALEARIWSEISAVLRHPDLLSTRFNESEDNGSLAEDIQSAERDIAKWNRKNERLVSLYVGEDIDKAEFDHQRKYVTEPLEAAQERLAVLRNRQSQDSASAGILERFLSFAGEYMDSLDNMDDEAKRKLLHAVIDSATLSAENTPRYQLRVPAQDSQHRRPEQLSAAFHGVPSQGMAIGNTPSAWT